MAGYDDWTEQEFESRTAALDAVFDQYLGTAPLTPHALDAEYVMMALWLPSAGLGAMNPRREREKLLKVEKLAIELAATWMDLHYETRTQMELLSAAVQEIEGRHSSYSSRHPLSLEIVSVLDGLVAVAAPLANHAIDTAPIAGQRNLTNVAVIERLRHLWEERRGADAPKSMTEAGPFADFIFAAFETLDLPGNPRAAVDSWRSFRARYPILP